jgi:thiol:disulfide interchange protein
MIARLACLLGVGLAGLAVWFFNTDPEEGRVKFQRYDPAAFREARLSRKPTLVYLTAAADPACQEQNRGALSDDRVKAALEPFARFRIDAGRRTALAEQVLAQLNLGVLPTLVFANGNGTEVAQLVGVQSADAILAAAARTSR